MRLFVLFIIAWLLYLPSFANEKGTNDPPAFVTACDQIRHHDCEAAKKTLTQLAEKGHVKSQVLLGMLYQKGAGVKKDLKAAEQWFEKAAVKGEREAQTCLGLHLLNSPEAIKKRHEAKRWLHLAADRGCDRAKEALASLPGSEQIQGAAAKRKLKAQGRLQSTVQGVSDIRTSWKGYGELAKSMDAAANAAANAAN